VTIVRAKERQAHRRAVRRRAAALLMGALGVAGVRTLRAHAQAEQELQAIEESIEVAAPLQLAYGQWTRFEEFPAFMEGVEAVERMTDGSLHWIACVLGRRREWDARIVEAQPYRRVAWRSTTGSPQCGVVTLDPIDEARTRVVVRFSYAPADPFETAATLGGSGRRRIRRDLTHFKRLVEDLGSGQLPADVAAGG
jgi:uncharacterized membrane protein